MATEYDPRRADPTAVFAYVDRDGKEHEIKADGDGVVRPKNDDEVRVLDSFDLPVARKAKADEEPS